MMKNVKIKRLLKETVYKPLTVLNKLLPKNDKIILLYISSLGIRHNLKPLLEYLIEHKYNERYRIFCGIESLKYRGEAASNVKYITKTKAQLIFFFAKHVFYTAGQIPVKPGRNQSVIHLTHGAVYYKTMGALSNIQNGDEFFFSKMLVTGEPFKEIVKGAYRCKDDNILLCNEPMTDLFYKSDFREKDLGNYKKVILWLPTFRQSETLGYNNSDITDTLLIFKEDEYDELNLYLKEKSIRLIVKLHTSQSLKNVHACTYSNLSIYSHEKFVEEGFELYALMRQVDALIGDYSSASLQYLLLNRPMAFVIPDLEDYRKQRGFVFENPLDYMPGNIVVNKEEFYEFLEQISNDVDFYQTRREKVRDEIHRYQDGDACKRVLKASGINRC